MRNSGSYITPCKDRSVGKEVLWIGLSGVDLERAGFSPGSSMTKASIVATIGIHNNPEPTAIPLRSAFFFILGIAIEHKVVTNDHLDGSSGASERDSN